MDFIAKFWKFGRKIFWIKNQVNANSDFFRDFAGDKKINTLRGFFFDFSWTFRVKNREL